MNTPSKGVKSEAKIGGRKKLKKAEKKLKSEAIEEILCVTQWWETEHTWRM